MTLFLSELRLRWRSLVAWTASVGLLVLLVVSIYPTVLDNPDLDSIYGDLSPAAQALLGGSDLTSPAGYLNTQLFAFFLPAILLVFGITREEQHRSPERRRIAPSICCWPNPCAVRRPTCKRRPTSPWGSWR